MSTVDNQEITDDEVGGVDTEKLSLCRDRTLLVGGKIERHGDIGTFAGLVLDEAVEGIRRFGRHVEYSREARRHFGSIEDLGSDMVSVAVVVFIGPKGKEDNGRD